MLKKLGQLLKESQQEVSPYDYERIRFIFDLIVRLEPDDPIARKGLLILDILKEYKRRKPASTDELSHIAARLGCSIDKVSGDSNSFRLPYHDIFLKPWSVLEPELCDESIPRLLPLALPLELPTDQFYLVVVNNLIVCFRDVFTM